MKEVWKDIQGYERFYQVSNLGRVKSLDKTTIFNYKDGRTETRLVKGRILKPLVNSSNRLQVSLSLNGKQKLFQIHVLVALAFIGSKPEGQIVRHLDDNPQNNKADNLAYGTIKDNMIDAYKNGINHQKLSVDDVLEIKKLLGIGTKQTVIAFLFGVSDDAVSRIKRGKRFNWIKTI